MKRNISVHILLFVLVFFACITTSASAGELRFFLDGPGYNGPSSDPWLNEGYVTDFNDFLLNVVNTYNNKSVNDVKLVLAIPNNVDLGGLELLIGDTTILGSDFINSGVHPDLTGNNGIYTNARWIETSVGDLAKYDGKIGGTDTKSLKIQINNRPKKFLLHFDAYGETKNPGKVFVPFSKDLTVTPEPMGASLFLFGIATFIFGRRRKKT